MKTRKAKNEVNPKSNMTRLNGVVIGLLSSIDNQGRALVIFPGNPSETPVIARTTTPVDHDDVGHEVALMFEGGDPLKPLLIGLIQNPTAEKQGASHEDLEGFVKQPDDAEPVYLELDGERIDLKAENQITLKCGKASITLTRAGKVIIRGTYLLNRSSGVNRIKGGSVQIN